MTVAKLRILAIADEIVESLWRPSVVQQIKPDLIIAAGDLPWDYVEFFASAVDAPVVFVPGNHDLAIVEGRRSRGGLFISPDGIPIGCPRPIGATNLDLSVIDVAGVRIAGMGGCLRYRPGPHQYTQRQYVLRAKKLMRAARRLNRRDPKPIDLLVTHAPPLNLGDDTDRPHIGIEALHDVIETLQPQLHLHGHIHPHGQKMPDRNVGRTTVRNVIPYRIIEFEPLGRDEAPTASSIASVSH